MLQLISSNIVKSSKKIHQCDLCLENINVGESYKKEIWKDCCDIWNFKSHKHCHEILQQMIDSGWEGDGGVVNSDWFADYIFYMLSDEYGTDEENHLPKEIETLSMKEKVELVLNLLCNKKKNNGTADKG